MTRDSSDSSRQRAADDTRATSPEALEIMLASAARATDWGDAPPAFRATALRTLADAVDARGDELAALARVETNLGLDRLRAEVRRTSFQLRFMAEVLDEGSYLEAVIDTADASWPPGPRPDLRRVLHPIGPVLVFAGSNFPFAFSTVGGDTASALAAGCPVLVKAHPGHPRLSAAVADVVSSALERLDAPVGVFNVVFGDSAGVMALKDSRVAAASFTGSIAGGRALYDIAAARPSPIPFYGELGSINPVFVSSTALAGGQGDILRDYVASLTLSAGQFCTKPGVLILPRDVQVSESVHELLLDIPAAELLNRRIADRYQAGLSALVNHPAIETAISIGGMPDDDTLTVRPTVLVTSVSALIEHQTELLNECFGPASLIALYDDPSEMVELARALEGNLTASVHGVPGDGTLDVLVRELRDKAGRLLWNGWPTGVSVTWAMHHGGPYPATTAPLHTSVGASAIGRFMRPVCYQDFPDACLPQALQSDNPLALPRCINGKWKR